MPHSWNSSTIATSPIVFLHPISVLQCPSNNAHCNRPRSSVLFLRGGEQDQFWGQRFSFRLKSEPYPLKKLLLLPYRCCCTAVAQAVTLIQPHPRFEDQLHGIRVENREKGRPVPCCHVVVARDQLRLRLPQENAQAPELGLARQKGAKNVWVDQEKS